MSNFENLWSRLENRRPALSPRQPADVSFSSEISTADLFGARGEMVENCRAGLLLFNDDLDPAHDIVQNIETATGSFWHAIVHRREGDFSNARYWWNRTGSHPAFDEIFDIVIHKVPDFEFLDEIRESLAWDPIVFTRYCERADDSDVEKLELVQKIEMSTLLRWCASRIR
jgi:hypothetical protein